MNVPCTLNSALTLNSVLMKTVFVNVSPLLVRRISLSTLILTLGLEISSLHAQSPVARVVSQEVKALHIVANLVVDPADELLAYVDRARAQGANTVFYADSKLNTFGLNGTAGDLWDREMRKFVDGVKARNMKLNFLTIVMGFNGSMLADNPNLTTGYPIKNQPLRAVGNELRPVSTSTLANGGFENYADNRPKTWGFQDAVGERTFVDTQVKRSGRASFRAEARDGTSSRIFTSFPVKEFHQYTLRLWVKTENLTADNLLVLVRDANNLDRNLTNLRLSTPQAGGGRTYFNRPNNLTLEWTEVRMAFNSLNATEVNVALTVFGGQQGSVWWDDVAILDTPVLNWLNRDDLPRSIAHRNGTALQFDQDVLLPVDNQLGQSRFPGSYDTQHTPPTIQIKSQANIREGDTVTISGYHGLPTANGQVSASWNSPETYQRMRTIHQTLQNEFQPDGYLLNYSEIRTGGWEPSDTAYATSGQALAASIEQAYQDLFEIAPDADHYFWSDMVSPEHNAVANYYQINNTLDQSWVTLDSEKVVIATWWEGQKITDKGPIDLAFFSDLGFKQIVGAYYDANVTDNYNRWQTAAEGVDGVIGSMFATWIKDFSNIESFGTLWWTPASDDEPTLATNDWQVKNKATQQWIGVPECTTDYREATALVTTSSADRCTGFEFIPTDDGYYFLQNKATQGRYRPQDCSTTANDAVPIVQVGPGAYGWCEQWKLVDAGEGYYRIQNRQTGHWIRSQGCAKSTSETEVPITQVSQRYTGDCTKWKLVATEPTESASARFAPTSEEAVVLYPNPATHEVVLQGTSADVYRAVIHDTQGAVVKRFSPESWARTTTINVSGIRDGVYVLSVELEGGITRQSPLIIRH